MLEENGVQARLLGGVAVALRCPSARRPPLARDYHDLDLATTGAHAHRLSQVLAAAGFSPEERFNNLHGRSRMMFTGPDGVHVDVLVDEFVMCHTLSLSRRLPLHKDTLSLADLLLTKLQIAELNQKDAVDVAALLLDHPLTEDEAGINRKYVVQVVSNDWGWWRTVTENLQRMDGLVPSLGLLSEEAELVQARLHELSDSIAAGKRSLRWRMRARLGDRVPWRFDPEEVTP